MARPQPSGPSVGASQPHFMVAPAPPPRKVWSEAEEAPLKAQPAPGHHSCFVRFKFAIWLLAVVALVGAGVGLSIVMVVVQNNRNRDRPPSPPAPPPPPYNPEAGGGGGSTNGRAFTGTLPAPGPAPFPVPPGAQPIWWDEFDGDSLNTDQWGFDLGNGAWGWGNNELESYTDKGDNVRVTDGNLYITALKDGAGYTSARITTKETAAFYPGMQLDDGTTLSTIHVEASLQLPTPGQGLWPAFWMFPSGLEYGQWAASGEIDVMETVNEMVTITQGLQFGGEAPQNQKSLARTRQDGRPPYTGFHTFAVDWSLGKITLSVDGVESKTFLPRTQDPEGWFTTAQGAPAEAPFNQPFYLILNLAVGGLWPGPPDDTTTFPATLAVDYVRIWGYPG